MSRRHALYFVLVSFVTLLLGFFVGQASRAYWPNQEILVCHDLFAAKQDTLGVLYKYPPCADVYFETRRTKETGLRASNGNRR